MSKKSCGDGDFYTLQLIYGPLDIMVFLEISVYSIQYSIMFQYFIKYDAYYYYQLMYIPNCNISAESLFLFVSRQNIIYRLRLNCSLIVVCWHVIVILLFYFTFFRTIMFQLKTMGNPTWTLSLLMIIIIVIIVQVTKMAHLRRYI